MYWCVLYESVLHACVCWRGWLSIFAWFVCFIFLPRHCLGVDARLRGRSSKEMLACLQIPDKYNSAHFLSTSKITKAEDDPYHCMDVSQHDGSRKRLLQARKMMERSQGNEMMRRAETQLPKYDTKRVDLITNMSYENSVG
jgi:hypothetical protein